MEQIDIFKWLVRYHHERNLETCMPYLGADGVIRPPANRGLPVKEGRENKEYDGILIFKNGNTLVDRLINDKLVDARDVSVPMDVGTIDKLFTFLDEREDEDGVFVYESARGQMTRISKVRDINTQTKQLKSSVPGNFIYSQGESGEQELREMMGTKTRLAIELPQFYSDINAYQIKRSAYTPLGMGKVTHFDKDGLSQEFHMEYTPEGIIGVTKRYERGKQAGEEQRAYVRTQLERAA